jgi:LysR family transcriptional activator of nhaA
MGLRLNQWLGKHKLRPRVVGEFDDSAMVKSLGMQGLGVYIAPKVLDASVRRQYDSVLLGEASDLIEEFHVITVERRITHPGVVAITEAAREGLFADWRR